MREYGEFFDTARPHQGLEQQIPIPQTRHQTAGPVRCRNVRGGIIHDYYREVAWYPLSNVVRCWLVGV